MGASQIPPLSSPCTPNLIKNILSMLLYFQHPLGWIPRISDFINFLAHPWKSLCQTQEICFNKEKSFHVRIPFSEWWHQWICTIFLCISIPMLLLFKNKSLEFTKNHCISTAWLWCNQKLNQQTENSLQNLMISLSKVIKGVLKLQQKTWHIVLSLFHHLGEKSEVLNKLFILNNPGKH